jgi:hypothetical protein
LNYLHYEFDTGPEDVIEVSLRGQANVRLLDNTNFEKYSSGQSHHFALGGFVKVSPVDLRPPSPGHWHVVIDLGGYAGRVGASVRKVTDKDSLEDNHGQTTESRSGAPAPG